MKISSLFLCTSKKKLENPQNILLSKIAEKSVIKVVAEELLSSHFHEVIAVVGSDAFLVEHELKGLPLKVVHNKYYDRGYHTSIKAGVMNLDLQSDFFAVCFADHVKFKKNDYNHLMATAREQSEALVICPTFQGKRGDPVLISSLLVPEILAHQDSEEGYSYLFDRYFDKTVLSEMESDACLY